MQIPKGHQLMVTDDGTPTLFSERFNEACHSSSGAKAETIKHYLEGCHLSELVTLKTPLSILEVGFGTGLGFRETRDFLKHQTTYPFKFYSLEIDEELVQWAEPMAQKTILNDVTIYQLLDQDFALHVIVGDARETLPKLKAHLPAFSAIYQDAFSPRRNPTLWTTEWFKLLGELSAPGAYLSTYSASVSIRKALVASGWGVSLGESFAQKRSSTRARWQSPSDPELLKTLELHSIPALSDDNLLESK